MAVTFAPSSKFCPYVRGHLTSFDGQMLSACGAEVRARRDGYRSQSQSTAYCSLQGADVAIDEYIKTTMAQPPRKRVPCELEMQAVCAQRIMGVTGATPPIRRLRAHSV